MTTAKEKNQLRAKMKATLATISSESRKQSAQQISQQLQTHPQLKTAHHIAAYLAMPDELSLDLWIKNNITTKTIYLPRFNPKTNRYELASIHNLEKDTVTGPYHIREPKSIFSSFPENDAKQKIEVWLIPGLAFDHKGNRLGRGKGIYDQFLKNATGYKIGIAFEDQIHSTPLPTTNSDIKLDAIITPKQIIII